MHKRDYSDIIELDHHVSDKHPPMPRENRAAQFAPFAALTGYDDSIREASRLTSERITLSDEENRILNTKLAILEMHISEHPKARLTHFVADEKKRGGEYIVTEEVIRRIDTVMGEMILDKNQKIRIADITDISSDLLDNVN